MKRKPFRERVIGFINFLHQMVKLIFFVAFVGFMLNAFYLAGQSAEPAKIATSLILGFVAMFSNWYVSKA